MTKVKSPYLFFSIFFSKTFDSVNHDLSLNKLAQLNIDSTWFASYLHNRTHSVKIDKIMSKAQSNFYGVPQGSILGPILFNIFINDIPKINSLPEITTSTTIYADDVQLLFSGTPNNLKQLKIYAETSLKTMKEWYSENGLKINSTKLNSFFLQHQLSTKGQRRFK